MCGIYLKTNEFNTCCVFYELLTLYSLYILYYGKVHIAIKANMCSTSFEVLLYWTFLVPTTTYDVSRHLNPNPTNQKI